MRTLTYYIATSIDGFIADGDGDFSFFPLDGDHIPALATMYPETFPVHARRAMEIEAPNSTFDTVIMGRHTYEPALNAGIGSPYPHLDQHVVSRRLSPDDTDDAITLVPDDPLAHVQELKRRDGLGIWLCGGGLLAASLIDEIDELIVKLNPVVLGDGRRLFAGDHPPLPFELTDRVGFTSGVTVLHFTR